MISLLVWTALALAMAEEPVDKTPLADEVPALVRSLDSAQLTQRDAAERKLLELGPGVLPLLPTIGQRTSAEVALRVTRVQQKLLRAQALAAAESSLVSMKGDMPLSEVLAEIAKQTGNPISDHREAFGEQAAETRVKVDFDKTPFWKAMDNVLDQADLTLYGFTGERGAFVVSRPDGSAPRTGHAFYTGIFRLEGVRFEAVRDLRNESMASLKFFMEVSWEPRLQPFALLQSPGEISAIGSDGETIAVGGEETEPEALVRGGTSSAELEIPMALPKRGVEKIGQVKGKLLALVPGPIHEFRFADLPVSAKNAAAQRIEQRQAGATVIIDQVRKNNEAWEVSVRVKFEGPTTALESHRSWILENEAYFEDADGKRIEAGGIEQSLQSKDEVGINYFFDLKDGPKGLAFVYRTPIVVLELPVEYEFRDLRLP